MLNDLLKKERQKLWAATSLSATDIPTYGQALASPEKTIDARIDHRREDLGEHLRRSGARDVLLVARAASGL